jgi:hypothetical protein
MGRRRPRLDRAQRERERALVDELDRMHRRGAGRRRMLPVALLQGDTAEEQRGHRERCQHGGPERRG